MTRAVVISCSLNIITVHMKLTIYVNIINTHVRCDVLSPAVLRLILLIHVCKPI